MTRLWRATSRERKQTLWPSGGSPLCRVGNGPQAGSVKYAEGRHAALRELPRHLRTSPDAAVLAPAAELLDAWETARRQAETQGPAWAAYRQGGVAELRSLVDDLAAATTDSAH